MTLSISLFGVESVFTAEMIETAHRCKYHVESYIVAGEPEWDLRGLRTTPLTGLTAAERELPFAVPWVTPGYRFEKVRAAHAAGFRHHISMIDPTAVVATSADIAAGVYVNSAATVGAYTRMDVGCLVNRNASVGHHCSFEPFVSLGPGATIAARCTIGRGSMIGAGAVIAPGVSVGANCLVAIGAVVRKNLPDNCLVSGNPARVMRTGISGYKDAAVGPMPPDLC